MVADSSVRVLVVDDEPEILEVICELLSGHLRHAHVLQAGCGVEAMDMIRRHAPHIVVSDYRMPDRSGLEVLRCARENGAAVTMMLTAFPDVDVATSAVNYTGLSGFFVKPPDPDDFLQRIQTAIDDVLAHAARGAAFARALAQVA